MDPVGDYRTLLSSKVVDNYEDGVCVCVCLYMCVYVCGCVYACVYACVVCACACIIIIIVIHFNMYSIQAVADDSIKACEGVIW